MAPIDDLITTYLTACEVEGKTPNTVASYLAPRWRTSAGLANSGRCRAR